jgi:uncharacterized protein (DUF58 family)
MSFAKQLTLYAAASCTLLVGWVLNVAQLYWMAVTLFLLPVVCRFFGKLEHRGLVLTREAPRSAHQGEAVAVRLSAENHFFLPKLNLSLADEWPAGLSTTSDAAVPLQLPPRARRGGEYTLQMRRRGLHVLPSIKVRSSDPLGLREVETVYPLSHEILVYPRVVPLPSQVMPPSVGGGRAPLESAQRRGEGASFLGVREYRPGDPLRHVHWRTAARLGKLAVVEWEAEESVDALLAVETLVGSERDMGPGTTLDLAAGLAASMGKAILFAGDSLRLLLPGNGEWRADGFRGPEAMPEVLESLARMRAVSDVGLAAEVVRRAAGLAPGTLVCWMTPFLSAEVLAAARTLRAARLRPVIYVLETVNAGRAGAWEGIPAELESIGVSVVRLFRDDALVRRLLD